MYFLLEKKRELLLLAIPHTHIFNRLSWWFDWHHIVTDTHSNSHDVSWSSFSHNQTNLGWPYCTFKPFDSRDINTKSYFKNQQDSFFVSSFCTMISGTITIADYGGREKWLLQVAYKIKEFLLQFGCFLFSNRL